MKLPFEWAFPVLTMCEILSKTGWYSALTWSAWIRASLTRPSSQEGGLSVNCCLLRFNFY